MKRILLLSITLIVLTAIAFAQDSDTDQSAPDNEAVEFESEFGLQARIFQSVQQRSMNINASYTGRSNYLLTPGDIYVISMDNVAEGSSQSITNYSVQLQEDYTIDAPFIGTVSVEGLTLSELQQLLSERIKNSVPTQYVNVALETPAQFEIFLYGGVNLPGYITATPLLRVTDAIAMAHGFKPSGSYRSIRLERNGEILNLDLSRFYADANNEENPTLRPGDRIYIPEADVVTEIQGNVAFPGVYELKENETLADLLRFAGGLLPNAETSDITIVRVQEQNVTQRLSATASMADEIEIQNGDTVRIGSRFENSSFVILEGAVYGSSFSN
ncbi:MAG: SLBB domain-containing protein, partial [Spirochaetia bacterium]